MSAAPLRLRDMSAADLDTVTIIEQQIHAHPWTRGNFSDALASNNLCKVLEQEDTIIGYLVMLPAVDEMELLDIGITTQHQHKGWGRRLLDEALGIARARDMTRMLLEVRPSNVAARRLYERAGFSQIGLRRSYYPTGSGREDAIVMECRL